MSQLGLILQESLRTETQPRTILGLLTEQMDGGDGVEDRGSRRRRSFKQRLGFLGMGCCGVTWGFSPATATVAHGEEGEGGRQPHQQQQLHETNSGQAPNSASGPDCVRPATAGSGMNLAAALAAERQFRGSHEADAGGQGGFSAGDNLGGGGGGRGPVPGTPWRVSLMKLLEETEGGDAEVVVVEGEGTAAKGGGGGGGGGVGLGNDSVCCVCMGRKKGAAFIPCGHTFCRVCSRELWLNRGSCPLCNRSILEILDIF